jgi:HEAT repeat protein
LVQSLGDPNPATRMMAAEGLGDMGPIAREAVPALARATRDPDLSVRAAAIEALGGIGPFAEAALPDLMAALMDGRTHPAYASQALYRIGPAAVAPLIESLAVPDVEGRAPAVLEKLGPVAVPALKRALDDPRAPVKDGAAMTLARIAPPAPREPAKEPVSMLIADLNDPDLLRRRRAIDALGRRGAEAKDAVPALIRLLERGAVSLPLAVELQYGRQLRTEQRFRVIAALGRIGPPAQAALPSVQRFLRDKDLEIVAAEAIARISPAPGPARREAIEVLVRAWRSGGEPRREALEAFVRIGPAAEDAIPALAKAMPEAGAPMALASIGAAAVPALSESLRSSDRRTQQEAMRALAKIGPAAEDAAPLLARLLPDPQALETLGAIGAFEPLIAELKARPHAGLIGPLVRAGEPAVPSLIVLLGHDDARVRRLSAEVLGAMRGKAAAAVPALTKAALGDPDQSVRDRARRSLGNIGPAAKDAAPALAQVVEREEYGDAYVALHQLVAIGPAAAPELARLLAHPNGVLRHIAADALVAIGPAALPHVEPILKHPQPAVRMEAEAVALRVGKP